jgi:hypothetical protein
VTPSAGAAAGAATGRGAGGKAGGAAGAGARQPMVCMTAPAKAPSSRTFARQRQQLSQQLYNQWNAQVGAAAGGDDALLLMITDRAMQIVGLQGLCLLDWGRPRLLALFAHRTNILLYTVSWALPVAARAELWAL